jgi:sarcosine/dimethylglycine N-methyltransferase
MESKVIEHYNSENLTDRIRQAIIDAGKDPSDLQIKDLAGIDQLHTGGAKASLELLNHVTFPENAFILDAGCGIGGSSRLLSKQLSCKIIGVDLADEFIGAANYLTRATHFEKQVKFQQGSVLDLPFDKGTFDGVLCQHILMNIEDKACAIKEFHRILKPGGKLVLHEITKGKSKKVQYPVPWAAQESISFLKSWDFLKNILLNQGFQSVTEKDKSQDAMTWWEKVNTLSKKMTRPVNPLNPSLIFGTNSKFFGKNMTSNFQNHTICLIEAVYKKGSDA